MTESSDAIRPGDAEHPVFRGLTLRALIYGTVATVLIAVAGPYVGMVCQGELAADSTPVAVVFVFAVVLFLGNMLMRGLANFFGRSNFIGRFFNALKLRMAELVVVYIMALICSAIPTYGFSENFFSILGGAARNATTTNAWSEKIMPHINRNMVPFDPAQLTPRGLEEAGREKAIQASQDPSKAEPITVEEAIQKRMKHIDQLFDGMPGLQNADFINQVWEIPWPMWVTPFLYWMVFIFAFYFVCTCMVSILRKQWIERERLQYPLVQLPMAMVEGADARRGIPALFRDRILWIGFALPMLLITWNSLSDFFQLVTPITTNKYFQMFDRRMNVTLQLIFPVIGFTYLIKTDVALSLWFFCLLGTMVGSTFRQLGIQVGSRDMWMWRGHEHPWLYHACMGGVILLGIVLLWSARRALWDVVKKAVFFDRSVDDSKEMMPHFFAFWGLVAGLGVMEWWLIASGMSWWFAAVVIIVALLGLLAATRLIAEGGLAFVQFPLLIPSFLFRTIKQSFLGPANLVALSFVGVWAGDIRVMLMPALANSTKLADHVRLKQRSLLWLFLIAVTLGIVLSSFVVLWVGYTRGGAKTATWTFGEVSKGWFEKVAEINIPTDEQAKNAQKAGEDYFLSRTVCTGIGAGILILLTVLRARFLWWPLHPIGFPFSIMPAMQKLWLSIFIGWLLKSVILRYGGAVLFRKLKPFFFGLILGEFVTGGLWYIFYTIYVVFFHGVGKSLYNG